MPTAQRRSVFSAPADHGAVGPFDELLQLAIAMVPLVGVGLWSFGRRVNELLDHHRHVRSASGQGQE
jgi:hypothetical protein